MAVTVATSGFGTLLADGGTTIAEITKIGGVGPELQMIEVTHMLSPGAQREFIPGLIANGDISFEMNMLPGSGAGLGQTQRTIIAAIQSRLKKSFTITWPDSAATVWSFSGYYTKYEGEAPVDNKMTAKVTIKVTGVLSIPT